MEVVVRRVVVDLELVGPLRKRASVELDAVRVKHVDLEGVRDRSRQRRQRERIRAGSLRRVGRADPINRAVPHDVQVAAGVLAERLRVDGGYQFGPIVGRVGDPGHVRADVSNAVVGVEVAAVQAGDVRVTDDVAARDRATKAVRVLEDRWDVVCRLRTIARRGGGPPCSSSRSWLLAPIPTRSAGSRSPPRRSGRRPRW